MAEILNLFALLKKLMARELSSFSSVGFNNLLFFSVFIMSGSHRPQDAFWSTLLFQLVILAPLLVTFSVDTQHRLPQQRVATWPLTDTQKLLFSAVSFALNPLFFVLFLGFLFWMGVAIACVFVFIGFFIHLLVYMASRILAGLRTRRGLTIPLVPWKVGGVAQQMWRELSETLDFWAAFLVAIAGMLYRLFGHSPDPDAFPILSIVVAIAMSTIAQRMLSLNEGRALLRYRLLPIAGWKVLATQDAAFLMTVAALVSPLNLRAGFTCSLVALTIGRHPSLTRRVSQRRWRFVGGDPRFGTAQLLLGGVAGIGAVRLGLKVPLVAVLFYAASLFWGERLWKRYVAA